LLEEVVPKRRGDIHEIAEQIVEDHVGIEKVAGQDEKRRRQGVGNERPKVESQFFFENAEEFHIGVVSTQSLVRQNDERQTRLFFSFSFVKPAGWAEPTNLRSAFAFPSSITLHEFYILRPSF
jgi:hypothetical protein